MSGFYNYDTRPASPAAQIMTLERLLEEAADLADERMEELVSAQERIIELEGELADAEARIQNIMLVNEQRLDEIADLKDRNRLLRTAMFDDGK